MPPTTRRGSGVRSRPNYHEQSSSDDDEAGEEDDESEPEDDADQDADEKYGPDSDDVESDLDPEPKAPKVPKASRAADVPPHPLWDLRTVTKGLIQKPACSACGNLFHAFDDDAALTRHLLCHSVVALKWEMNERCPHSVSARSLLDDLDDFRRTGALGTKTVVAPQPPPGAPGALPTQWVFDTLSSIPRAQWGESLLPALLQMTDNPELQPLPRLPPPVVEQKEQKEQRPDEPDEPDNLAYLIDASGSRRSKRQRTQATPGFLDREHQRILAALRDSGNQSAAQLGGGTGLDYHSSKLEQLAKMGLVRRESSEMWSISGEGIGALAAVGA